MPELATYIGVEPRTSGLNVSGSLIARGLRVTLNATGNIVLAGLAVRGDYVTAQDIANNENGLVFALQQGNKVPMQAGGTNAVADLAYSAANGQVTNVATSAVLLGRFTQPGTAGAMTEVELFNPA